ncbi:hypothetical protein HYALB_00007569 [Hymenoscyphus albidus]|uniref:Protoporphyrinogen oxidase n=1 Tax=Hymenoscyphus albidus TaxID=595503 RepID=A0A9N9LHY6_9HELO|nr:hypothetical protein HYALB_00007569 [Hymenoscyphus albidus]
MPRVPSHAVAGLLRRCYATPISNATRRSPRLSTPRQCHSRLNPRLSHLRTLHSSRNNHANNPPSRTIGDQIPNDWLPPHDAQYTHEDKYIREVRSYDEETGRYAIIGGGITGLAAAYWITSFRPQAKVTIFEGSERLGGWISSRKVKVDGGEIVFEQGPRTLRGVSTGSGLALADLICALKLGDELRLTSQLSEAAQNRFVYYPDHLVKVPSKDQGFLEILWTIFMEPAFKWLPRSTLMEYWVDPRPATLEDESIASYLERRLGTKDCADNLASGVMHGIYAGDINLLSVKSILPRLWHLEGFAGGIVKGLTALKGRKFAWEHRDGLLDMNILLNADRELLRSITQSSVYSFQNGMETLTKALEKFIRANPNVTIKTGTKVENIKYHEATKKAQVSTRTSPNATFKKAISTISGPSLASIVTSNRPQPLQSLASIHSVTVMVINLYFSNPNLLSVHGFGYLIPQGVPFDQNPEHALGVVFDSDCISGQDTVDGTKLTVMLGGHWWDDFPSYPTESEGLELARSVLKRHLGIEEEPSAVQVGLHKNCIPQYTVGHEERLRQAHFELLEDFKGTLAVAGNSFGGVGVADCVRGTRELFFRSDFTKPEDLTGLSMFAETQDRLYEYPDPKYPFRAGLKL